MNKEVGMLLPKKELIYTSGVLIIVRISYLLTTTPTNHKVTYTL